MREIEFNSGGISIPGELYSPTAPNGQAMIVVYGSDGMKEPWGTAIRRYASDLASRRFIVLIPDYFQKTATGPGMDVFSQMSSIDAWARTVGDAFEYVKSIAGTPAAPGLLGFSLGGNICLRLRGSAQALVAYFAPELHDFGGIGSPNGPEKPPAQLHHGTADVLVPIAESLEIAATLRSQGNEVQLFSYESAGHGFVGADEANATAARVSRERTLAFFDRTMQGAA